MADQRSDGVSDRRDRPWWAEAPPPRPAEEREPQQPPSQEGAGSFDWFERREPILRALATRFEPLERVVERLVGELGAARADLDAFAQETRKSVAELADGLAAAKSETTERTGALDHRIADGLVQLSGALATLRQSLDRHEDRSTRAIDEARAAVSEAEGRLTAALGRAFDSSRTRLDQTGQNLEARIADAAQSTGAQLSERADVLQAQLAEAAEATRARISEAAEANLAAVDRRQAETAAAVGEGIRRLEERLAGLADAEEVQSVRAALQDVDTSLRGSLNQLTALVRERQEQVDTGLRQHVTAAAGEIRAEQKRAADRLAERLSGSVRSFEEGVAAVRRLADVIDAMAAKRGFRELVASEEQLRQEQTEHVERLTKSGAGMIHASETLSARMDQLEVRLSAVMEEALAVRTVPGQTSEQVAAALAAAQAEVLEAHRNTERVAETLRGDLDRLRERIDGWGKARSAPHLAAEITSIQERVDRLEGEIGEPLVQAVAQRVTRDLLAALEERDRSKRGLFRR